MAIAVISSFAATAQTGLGTAPTKSQFVQAYGQLPLYFVENQGQTDAAVAYVVNGNDTTLFFTSEGVTFAAVVPETDPARRHSARRGLKLADRSPGHERKRWSLKLDFIGGQRGAQPVAQEPTPAVVSYFKGPRERWKTGLRTYAKLVYPELWPGIDLELSGTASQLKQKFVVKPGADPRKIRLGYRGASKLRKVPSGKLELTTPAGLLHHDTPVAFQHVNGRHVPVPVDHRVDPVPASAPSEALAPANVGFELGQHDGARAVEIEQAIFIYSDVIGGAGGERGLGIEVDAAGNAYVCGNTGSSAATFPEAAGPDLTFNSSEDTFDAFVLKLDPTGTQLLYAGYIGGAKEDTAFSIAVGADGSAYVGGGTYSSEATFPVRVGPGLIHRAGPFAFGFEAFVAKVSPDGRDLVYCGYIGGSGDEAAEGVAVDAAGNLYVTGYTTSDQTTFPVAVGPDLTHNGAWDTFVAKVKPDGSGLIYCGYIGGSGDDALFYTLSPTSVGISGGTVAVDDEGSAYVASFTASRQTTFPNGNGFAALGIPGPDQTYNGGTHDAFVAKVRPDGSGLTWCGYVGGSGWDGAFGIAVDPAHNAYLVGFTSSSEATFPKRGGPDLHFHGGTDFGVDAFVAKVRADGSGLIYCGYIGGPGDDNATNIRVDADGNAYIVGETESSESTFPVTGGPDLTFGGNADAFVAKLKSNPTDPVVTNNFEFLSYIGLSGQDAGFDIAVDAARNVYVCGDLFANDSAFVVKIASGSGLDNKPYLDHFAWSPVGPTHLVNVPFPVTITALDPANNTVSNFTGRVTLTGLGTQGISFGDDFEDGSIADWQAGLAAYTRQVTTETAAGGTHCLTLIGGACRFNGLSHSLPNLRPDRITFHVRAGSAAVQGANLAVGTGTAESQIAAWFSMEANGTMGPNGRHISSYASNHWYKVTLAFDWASKQFHYYLDDNLIRGSIPFYGSGVERLSVLHLFNASFTQVWWDEIRCVQTGQSSPVAISPASSDNFINGVWSGTITVTQEATEMTLQADDGLGHAGVANTFSVQDPVAIQTPLRQPALVGESSTFSSLKPGGADLELKPTGTWPGVILGSPEDVAVLDNRACVAIGSGLVIFDVSDPSRPRELGNYNTSAKVNGVTMSGTYAFLANDTSGLQIIDISNPANPQRVGGLDTPGVASKVAVAGGYAIVADGSAGLQIIDVRNPANPQRTGGYDTSGFSSDVAVSGSYAYVADGAGLQVIDVSNPASPQRVGGASGSAIAVALSGNYAYVVGGSRVQILDIRNPENPQFSGAYSSGGCPNDVIVSGNYAYLSDQSGATSGCFGYGLVVLDVSVPESPQLMSTLWRGQPWALAISGNDIFMVTHPGAIEVINVNNPRSPQFVGSYITGAANAYDVAVAGNYAYVAGGYDGLLVIDLSDPTKPSQVGRHDDLYADLMQGIALSGSYAYAAIGGGGLAVYDISNPPNPRRIGGFRTGTARDVAVSGGYAYVADEATGLHVIDIGTPANPQAVGRQKQVPALGVAVSGNYAYLVYGCDGLRILDIRNPASPKPVGGLGMANYALAVAVQGNYAYVADNGFGLQVIDISDPTNPRPVGSFANSGGALGVAVSGNYVTLADGNFHLIDVSVPASPQRVGGYDTRGYAQGVAVSGDFAYVADAWGGMSIIDLSCFLGADVCIGQPPQDQTVAVGLTAQFNVAAFGTGPLRYQWLKGGVPVVDETNALLTLANTQPGAAGSYSVVVRNVHGPLGSLPATLTVVPLIITNQPRNLTVRIPSNYAALSVGVLSSVPVTYQWRFNGAAIGDATSATLTISNVMISAEGDYTVIVANSYGMVTSAVASLAVLTNTMIVQPPLSQSAVAGGSVTFSVEISGHPPPFDYEWRKLSTPLFTNRFLLNERRSFFTMSNVAPNLAGNYRVVVRNAANTNGVNSGFTLTVPSDADGDRMPDAWESSNRLNAGVDDAALDADGDGSRNVDEYLAGTDPQDPQSYLKIDRITASGSATLWFGAVSNKTYTVQFTDALPAGRWSTLVDVVARPSNRIERVTDPATTLSRYYRLATPRLQ